MDDRSGGPETHPEIHLELYFLIAKFLESGPCKKAAEALQEELKTNKLLPKRLDWEGQEHLRSYQSLKEIHRHISPTHLVEICQRIGPILDKEIPPSVKGIKSLLGAGRQSLLRKPEAVTKSKWINSTYTVRSHGLGLKPSVRHAMPNFAVIHCARELSGTSRPELTFQGSMYANTTLLAKSLGHLSAVYCVAFDRTGTIIFTGADDNLVKIWSVVTGRLLATMRGHAGEVSDMAVSLDNTLLATGSCDKTIRVWCLRSTAPVAILHAHTGMITSLQFCPYRRGDNRYLASTGGDGCVCFWTYNVKTKVFNPKPFKFIERSRAGAQMLCSSFSPGGIFLATGNSDHVVRVYSFNLGVPEKICELEMHRDRVDSIQYSHADSRFISGSKDGTARIWRYDRQQWKAIVLYMAAKPTDAEQKVSVEELRQSKLRLTMVAWTSDDRHVLTAVSDYTIKRWDSHTGDVCNILTGHQNEVFVLEQNPTRPNILLSAGHDGYIIVWDMFTGDILYKYFNVIQGQGHGAVFDCKWAPDGLSFAATDSHGFLLYFGFGSNEAFKKCPEEQFFHTDYRPLVRDAAHYALDEQTQRPPHLMPPAFLVDMDGNPHPPALQRLVPGREHCTHNAYLTPVIGTANNGDREVLDESVADAAAAAAPVEAALSPRAPSAPAPGPRTPTTPQPTRRHSSSDNPDIIDHMIDRLQQELDERIHGTPRASTAARSASIDHDYSAASSASSSRPSQVSRSPRRASTSRHPTQATIDEELPSTSTSSSHPPQPSTSATSDPASSLPLASRVANISVWSQRQCVPAYEAALYRRDQEFRDVMADEEIKHFMTHKKRKPLPHSDRARAPLAPTASAPDRRAPPSLLQGGDSEAGTSEDSGASYSIRTRRHRRPRHRGTNHGYRTRRSALNEETATNRLVTRALYDTDVEEYSTPQDLTQEEDEEMDEEEEDEQPVRRRHHRPNRIADDDDDDDDDQHSDDVWKDSSSSNSESSDYSDWAVDGGDSIAPPKRQSQRKKKRRRWNLSENEEDEDSDKTEVEEEKEEDGDETEIDVGSPEVKQQRSRRPAPRAKRKESRKQRNKRNVLNNREKFSELPEAFRPPEWLTECVPRKSPYHPQIGDQLVYFRQGHALYVQAVRMRAEYAIDVNKNQPWHKNTNLREQELVKVTAIKYEIRPPRLVCLKLAFIEPDSGRLTGGHFTVKYHDMPDVVDFLVLRQTYNQAIDRNWMPGDRFRCMIDDMWWVGSISSREPFEEEFPDSQFQCINVAWDNGEREKMSPWDLEPIDQQRLPNVRGGSVPILDEEMAATLYTPAPHEWPAPRDLECERIGRGLEQVMQLSIAEWFLAPVDLNAFPIYGMVIEYPIDLSLIRARIHNKFYRRLAAIQYDVRLIEQNARTFNEAGTDIVKNARSVTELCLRMIKDPACTDVRALYQEMCAAEAAATEDGQLNGHGDSLDHDAASAQTHSHNTRQRGARGRRLSAGPASASTGGVRGGAGGSGQGAVDPDAWKLRCAQLVEVIMESDDSAPFRAPVNIEVYQDYLQVIDTPMDFGTIRERVADSYYDNPNDLRRDARLVFHNSKTYNTNTRSRIYAMTLRLSAMFEEQMGEIIAEWKSSKRQGKRPVQPPARQRSHPHANTRRSRPSPTRPTRHTSSPPPRRSPSPARVTIRGRGRGGRVPGTASASASASSTATTSSSATTTSAATSSAATHSGPTRREGRPQRAVKRRRLMWDSEEEDDDDEIRRPSRPKPRDSKRRQTTAVSNSDTELEEEEPAVGAGKRSRNARMLGRVKALKRAASSGTAPMNGAAKKEPRSMDRSSSSRAERRHPSPSPSTTTASHNPSSSQKHYTTRIKTGAVGRRQYNHMDSDDDISPRPAKQRRTRIVKSDSEPEEDDEEGGDKTEEEEEEGEEASSASDSSDKENNEESDSGTEEYSADEFSQQPQQVSTKIAHKPRQKSTRKSPRSPEDERPRNSTANGSGKGKSLQRSTRNKGKRTVTYEENSDFEVEETTPANVSSRGRVRKISAKVRGAMFGD